MSGSMKLLQGEEDACQGAGSYCKEKESNVREHAVTARRGRRMSGSKHEVTARRGRRMSGSMKLLQGEGDECQGA